MFRSEVTIKFSGTLPEAKQGENKKILVEMKDQNGTPFFALLNPKSWRKAEANAASFEQWGGAIGGKLGQQTKRGFEILEAGIQIFEKKQSKEVKQEDASPADRNEQTATSSAC